jgi:hypothetical protein
MPISLNGSTGIQFPDSSLQAAAASPYVLKNRIINGAMQVWQRGTSFTNVANGTFTADRFSTTTSGINLTVTQDTLVPSVAFKYSLKAVPASNATPSECGIRQFIEQQNIFDFAGQTVTGSAWVYCSKSSVKFRLGTQNATGGTDVVQNVSVTAATWTRITFSFSSFSAVTAWTSTPNASGGYLDIGFADSTALTTSDYLYITGVQLEQNTSATPFERRLYNQELANCQRYYETYTLPANYNTIPFQAFNSNNGQGSLNFKVTKRASPSSTLSQVGTLLATIPNGNAATGNVTLGYGALSVDAVSFTAAVTSGLVAGNISYIYSTAGATLAFNSEL